MFICWRRKNEVIKESFVIHLKLLQMSLKTVLRGKLFIPVFKSEFSFRSTDSYDINFVV